MRKTASALAILAFFGLGQFTPPPKVAGPAGPAKEFATGELRKIDPGFSCWVRQITIVTADEEWNTALAGWRPMKCLGICLDDARILIRATSGIFPTEHTINHEIGHAVWNGALGRKDRARVLGIFNQAKAGSRPFPTKYSQRNEEEFFAEGFAIYLATGRLPEAPEIARILDKMRIL